MSKSRHFTFTSFDIVRPEDFFSGFSYLLYQQELCPNTSRLHWQGAISFTNPRSLSGLIKAFKGPHYEIARSKGASRNYCRKSDTHVSGPFEFGVPTDPVPVPICYYYLHFFDSVPYVPPCGLCEDCLHSF